MKNQMKSAIALAGVLAVCPAANAALLVYESFDYDLGELTGQNGGIGFASGWEISHTADRAGNVYDSSGTGSLTWDGTMDNGYPTAPASVRYMGATDTGSSDVAVHRQLDQNAATMAGAGNVLWMSTIYHLPNRAFGAGPHIGLASGTMWDRSRAFESSDTSFIGSSPYTGSSNVWNTGNLVPTIVDSNTGANAWENFSRTVGPTLPPTDVDMLLVMRFTFGDSTTVEAMMFGEDVPLSAITEAAFDSGNTSATYADGIDASELDLLVINQGRFENALDEIRVGTTFDAVVIPEPTTALLGSIGLLALLRRRRG